MTYSSVVTLCLAAIASLLSVALAGIAFSTDNWRHIAVDRPALRRDVGQGSLDLDLATDHRTFDRTQGIFRVCFPQEEKPLDHQTTKSALYLNPVEEWCTNIDYHVRLLDRTLVPVKMSHQGTVWFHLARSAIAGFCLYFMFMGVGCVTGFLGCWRASGDHLITTATLFLLASLAGAAAVGLWHWAHFFEMEKVFDERLNFFRTWPAALQQATYFSLGWSYILAWAGLGLSLAASILFSCAAIGIRQEFRRIEEREMMVKLRLSYPGVATVMRQPNACMPGTPPMNHTRRHSLLYPNYYSTGYPVQFEETKDSREIKHKL